MTNERQLTETDKGAVVHACPDCAASEGWDLTRPLEELEIAMGARAETIFADQADHYEAMGYQAITMSPCDPKDSGIRLICSHLVWYELVESMEMRRKFLAEGLE